MVDTYYDREGMMKKGSGFMSAKIGVIGLGFVGGALKAGFEKRDFEITGYDKYKEIGSFEDVVEKSDVIFLCLPSLYVEGHGYDISAIQETCKKLSDAKYNGTVVLKSTVEPGTTKMLSETYSLDIYHNPEFLTARTAEEDFDKQHLIILGKYERTVRHTQEFGSSGIVIAKEKLQTLYSLYKAAFPDAEIKIMSSDESETMKIFANSFYAAKVQFFNELFFLCQKTGCNYNTIKDAVVDWGWTNPSHTNVPGPDGSISYGGVCFPKDTSALLHFMKTKGSPHKVLEAVVEERNSMRKD